MLTPEKLIEIENRLKDITPGPWYADKSKHAEGCYGSLENETDGNMEPLPCICFYNGGGLGEHNWAVRPRRKDYAGKEIDHSEQIANYKFIAHARQDIPLLLEEIQRLRKKLKQINVG